MLQIPLNQLKPAKNNVRKVQSSAQSLSALASSIQSQGLLHNLVVKKNGKGYEVIDGNRRLEALIHIYGQKSSNEISCIEIADNENEVGLHANMMREDMHPLDECDVIYALVGDGQDDFDSVGKRFGQTKQWVKQRVALSELSDKAKEMFRNYDFGIGVASALTLGTHEQQDKFLTDNDGSRLTAEWVRRHFTNQKIPIDKALFSLDIDNPKMVEVFGIESDLFSNDVFITNIDAFNDAQDGAIADYIEKKTKEGYADVIYLKDEYWFDSPMTKHLNRYHDDDCDIADLTLIITYNTWKMQLDETTAIPREIQEQSQLEEQAEEEEVEVSPMLMSEPQKNLLHGYLVTEAKQRLWDMEDHSELTRYMMSMICHRRLGYTYSGIHRVGNIHAEYQHSFPSEEYPDDYTTPEHEVFIESHVEDARKDFDTNGTSPLQYCLNLDRKELSRLFSAICLTGIGKYDVRHETWLETTPAPVDNQGWFKPDNKWLNKYKAVQIDMLQEYVDGTVTAGGKAEKINKLRESLANNPCFDPYGEWPQLKE